MSGLRTLNSELITPFHHSLLTTHPALSPLHHNLIEQTNTLFHICTRKRQTILYEKDYYAADRFCNLSFGDGTNNSTDFRNSKG
jgi:hypothetical protein